jgi:hypothetical protein
MAKTIVVTCGAVGCGAVIASRTVPDNALEQAKALIPAVMNCPKAAKNHPGYPAAHTKIEVREAVRAPAKTPEPARDVRTSPTTPPPPAPVHPEGATAGMVHLEEGAPDARVFESDEIPQGDVPESLEVEDSDVELTEPAGEWLNPPASDGSDEPR